MQLFSDIHRALNIPELVRCTWNIEFPIDEKTVKEIWDLVDASPILFDVKFIPTTFPYSYFIELLNLEIQKEEP